jgi:mRNA interferase MazF
VREGLRLLHRRAREMDLAAAYDEFYGDEAAPLPAGVAAGDGD